MSETQIIGSRVKDPQDKMDTGIDWDANDFLTNRATTIATSTWTVPTGLTSVTSSIVTSTKALVRLSGGTAGADYTVTNHVILANGEEYDRSILIKVRAR